MPRLRQDRKTNELIAKHVHHTCTNENEPSPRRERVYVTYFAHNNEIRQKKSAHFKSSVSFGRREEDTQHAAKLQLSVRTKSRTHFVKTCLQGFFMTLTPTLTLNRQLVTFLKV